MANLQVSVQTDYNGRGIQQAAAAMTDLNTRTIKQLQDRIKDLQKVLDNVRPNTSAFSNYAREINDSRIALERLQAQARRAGGALQGTMGGATSSVIEFNRVIQDAPYGIQGVGNNIQALAQNFGYLVNQTGSAGAATSAFFKSLISPASLAILAVSAITTAWTVYTQQQQKASSAAKDAVKNIHTAKEEIDGLVDSLSVQDRTSIKASESASEESTKLRIVYGVTQDVTMSLQQRNRAADQLQKMYPEYFKNQSNEVILAGKASAAYDTLSASIIATAKARAAVAISANNDQELLKIQLERNQRLEDEANLQRRVNTLKAEARKLGAGEGEIKSVNAPGNIAEGLIDKLGKPLPLFNSQDRKRAEVLSELYSTYKDIENINKDRTATGLREIQLTQEQYKLQQLVNDELKKGADITGKPGANFGTKSQNPLVDVIKASLQKSNDEFSANGLKGAESDSEKYRQIYEHLYSDIDKYVSAQSKKGIDVSKAAADAKVKLAEQSEAIQTNIRVTEAQRVANEVERINDESSVNSQNNMAKELAGVVKWYDAEIVKAKDSAVIRAAIEAGAQAQISNIRQKYFDKYQKDVDTITEKVANLENQGFSQNKTGLASDTKKIEDELQKRIDKINELYDAMQKLDTGNVAGFFGVDLVGLLRQSSIAKVTKNARGAEDSTDYQSTKALNQAITRFTSDMYDSISHIGKKNQEITDKYNKAREGATAAEVLRLNAMERQEKAIANSFGSVFSSIFDTFTNAMDNLFKNTLTNLLKTTFSKGLEDINIGGLGSKISSAIVAGAALAGNAISSIGGGKNTLTSGLGGALSGAASGAVLGTAIGGPAGTLLGAAAGGLVGAISGIFGASKKRKEEELQKQQLEEQKKTNAILDRQSRLAYSSQIIGRMTDRGVISGVDVNEFGQLTTTISGTDIVVSYDRTKKNQSRGV